MTLNRYKLFLFCFVFQVRKRLGLIFDDGVVELHWLLQVSYAGKFLAYIFWDQYGILLIDYLPKGQTINTEYYSSLVVQLKDILKEKRSGKFTKGVLFLHNNAPAHRPLATHKKLAYLGFQMSSSPTQFSGSGPVGLPPVPWTEKNNWKVTIFRPTRRSMLLRRPGWTDNILNFFFWVSCKS